MSIFENERKTGLGGKLSSLSLGVRRKRGDVGARKKIRHEILSPKERNRRWESRARPQIGTKQEP